MIALKSFNFNWSNLRHAEKIKILLILKSNEKSMILDDHKNEVGQPKPFSNRRESNTGNINDNYEYQFQTPRESSKIKKVDTNKDFSSLKRFQILQGDINENDQNLNENDQINNNSDSSKDKEKTMFNRKTKIKAPTTVILGD